MIRRISLWIAFGCLQMARFCLWAGDCGKEFFIWLGDCFAYGYEKNGRK